MSESTFKFKTVTMNEPLVDDPFYAWLSANFKKGETTAGKGLINLYLESLGFVVGQDRITEEQLVILRHVAEMWYRRAWGDPTPLAELFTDGAQYYVMGLGRRRGITPKLKDLVEESGWIYGVHPDTTYFEIVGGNKLYAKYQQILGSRFICVISDLEAT